MGQTIIDPRDHTTVYVNKKHRLEVEAVTRSEPLAATESGDSYSLGSGLVSISNTTLTPLFYLENHEDHEIIVESITIGIGDQGTHSATPVISLIRNPASIDFSTAADIKQNENFSSARMLKSDTLVLKGTPGDTVTGGDTAGTILVQPGSTSAMRAGVIIGVGNSICIVGSLGVSSGSAVVHVELSVYIHEDID